MGDARRRKQAVERNFSISFTDRQNAVTETFREIQRVGQGVMETWYYTTELMLAHLLYKPDNDTRANARCIDDFWQQLSRPDADCLCLFCDSGTFHATNPPRVFVILRPSIDAIVTKTHGSALVVCNGICRSCAGNLDTVDAYGAIGARIFKYWSSNLGTDVRLINPNVGHS
jgi:hypothetical protein